MERSRPIVGPLVGFEFVGKVVFGRVDSVESAAAAMEFVMDVCFVLETDFEEEVDLVVPLDFVVPQCSENLEARIAQYAEALL